MTALRDWPVRRVAVAICAALLLGTAFGIAFPTATFVTLYQDEHPAGPATHPGIAARLLSAAATFAWNALVLALYFATAACTAGLGGVLAAFNLGETVGNAVRIAHAQGQTLPLLLGIAPHGLLEIPAMAATCAWGTWAGLPLMRSRRGTPTTPAQDRAEVARRVRLFLRARARIVVALLLAAAVVERVVSPIDTVVRILSH